MTAGALAYERCLASGEWLMRIGVAGATPVLFIPPLFEEMNRTRALLVAAMRGLAGRGYGCWLADLPGTNESERALDRVDWSDWRNGVHAAFDHVRSISGAVPACASVRGGGLLDDTAPAACHWRFAPVAGASLARDLKRAGMAGGAELAGYSPTPDLLTDMEAASPAPVAPLRVVRLASDRAEADARLDGPALWRRSEPGTAPELSAQIAADIDAWVRQCAAS